MKTPFLYNALPAIEALHSAWSIHAGKVKYAPFEEALGAAAAKLDGYYQKTADSDAHILAMGVSSPLLHYLPSELLSSSPP